MTKSSDRMMTLQDLNIRRKNNKSNGPALVGIESQNKADYGPLIERMNKKPFHYVEVNKDEDLFHLLI
nr:hypothetical protein [Bacillus subtilis]